MATAAYHLIGVDVGTGSARAGLFTPDGRLLASAKRDIAIFHETGDIVEQSSTDIWNAVCFSVREAVRRSGVDPASVAGIGFDATCSLVVVGQNGAPLSVGPSDDPERNVIVWMDHRAVEQAERINATGHRVLDYVGGVISPEMETPKLLWLAEHQPETFAKAWQFFDLADYLTWRATGSLARSTCTLTCKWTYLGHERWWDASYFEAIGLGALAADNFARIGTDVRDPGSPLGGLSAEAAAAFDLPAGIAVGAGLIDAHAGGVGTVGASGGVGTLTSRMAYVMGTSACTMASTTEPRFVPGVWGPYFSAMVPGFWLAEGGQSAAGAALDHLVTLHPAAPEAASRAKTAGQGLTAWLSAQAQALNGSLSAVARHADDIHVVPDFLGNRSPFADPHARAVISGLTLDSSLESLLALYLAGLCGLGYGCRQIIAAMAEAGTAIDTIVISGGAGSSPLVRQILADSTGIAVAVSTSPEPVLLGSAMLGAVAAGLQPDLGTAMRTMSALGTVHQPAGGDLAQWHTQRFGVFEDLQRIQRSAGRRSTSTV
jgi:D-ribulokinase